DHGSATFRLWANPRSCIGRCRATLLPPQPLSTQACSRHILRLYTVGLPYARINAPVAMWRRGNRDERVQALRQSMHQCRAIALAYGKAAACRNRPVGLLLQL